MAVLPRGEGVLSPAAGGLTAEIAEGSAPYVVPPSGGPSSNNPALADQPAPDRLKPGLHALHASQPLRFDLAFETPLRASLAADGQSVRFADEQGAAQFSFSKLVVVDANGKVIPARMEMRPQGELTTKNAEIAEGDAPHVVPYVVPPSGGPASNNPEAADLRSPDRLKPGLHALGKAADRSVQFMGDESELRENNHGLHGSHGWNGEKNEDRLSESVPSVPSVVRNLPKSEFINQKSEILVSLVIDDRDAVYPLTIDPVQRTLSA